MARNPHSQQYVELTNDRVGQRSGARGVGPGEHEQGEGEAEHHNQCASLQLAGVDVSHQRAQLLQLLQKRFILGLQCVHPLLQSVVGGCAALDPLLQTLHILLLSLAALLS